MIKKENGKIRKTCNIVKTQGLTKPSIPRQIKPKANIKAQILFLTIQSLTKKNMEKILLEAVCRLKSNTIQH